MGKVTYGMMSSLDGYISDRQDQFDWGHVSEEVHRFAEAEQAREGIAIYGRRMYETMTYWETAEADPDLEAYMGDFARVWRDTDKIVVSSSLTEAPTGRTRLLRELPAEDLRRLKATTDKTISVAGPTLAATFLRQGLVDEVSIYFVPIVVGGGSPMFPGITTPIKLERLEQRSFDNGLLFVRYAVVN